MSMAVGKNGVKNIRLKTVISLSNLYKSESELTRGKVRKLSFLREQTTLALLYLDFASILYRNTLVDEWKPF